MSYTNIDLSKVDWLAVLPKFGIELKSIEKPKRRGPCPLCGGSTRFRMHNTTGRGDWVCNCGGGDGVSLVAKITGMTNFDALIAVKDAVNGSGAWRGNVLVAPSAEKSASEIAKARKSLATVQRFSRGIMGTAAALYLGNRVRGLDMSFISADIRFCEKLWHVDEQTGEKSTRPAMVALVKDASNESSEPVSIHRTYLTNEGQKAPVSADQVKKVMTATVNKLTGESTLLNTGKHMDTAVVVEGIEKGFAWVAALKNKVPVYSARCAYGLGTFMWPSWCKRLIIVADHEAPNPKTGLRIGLHHALLLRKRALEAGLRVLLVMPEDMGVDFDDYWNDGRMEMFNLKRYVDQSAYDLKEPCSNTNAAMA